MRIKSLILTTVLAVIGVSAPSPVAASYYENGVSYSTEITRDSQEYRVSIKAIRDMGGAVRLEVSIASVPDPDVLRQEQTWTFELESDEFVQTEDGFHIDVGGPGRPLDVHLTIAEGETPCATEQPWYITQAEGTHYRIETGNDVFGTITELPECGGYYSFSSGERPGAPRCPVRGTAIYSAMKITEPRRSDFARFSYTTGEARSLSGEQVAWQLKLKGHLEASSFYLSRRLSGRFDGSTYAWLSGVARFRPVDPLERTGWENCRGGREARRVYRHADIKGDLHVQVIGEEARAVTASDAYVERAWVRPRN